MSFVSRAGEKLEHALTVFGVPAMNKTCADLGCNVGGFTQCLLRRGAARVYAVDTGYGALDYTLRKDPRVVTMERTNALHATLPEKVQLIVIDVAWTKQALILPAAKKLLPTEGGDIVTLIKPHYEAPKEWLKAGVLDPNRIQTVLAEVERQFTRLGFSIEGMTESPLKGTAGNTEALAWLKPLPPAPPKPAGAPAPQPS